MRKLTYFGCLCTFSLCYIHYGVFYMLGNLFFMFSCLLFLRMYKRSKSFEVDPLFDSLLMEKNLGILIIVGMMGCGVLQRS